MRRLSVILWLSFFILVVIGCTQQTMIQVDTTLTSTTSPGLSITSTIIRNIEPTESFLETIVRTPVVSTQNSSITSLPSSQPTVTPSSAYSEVDWSYVPSCQYESTRVGEQPDFGIDGVIVYYDAAQEAFLALGGVPLENTLLPIPGSGHTSIVGFSPNGEWLAYAPISPAIGLLSSNGDGIVNTVDTESILSQLQEGIYLCGWDSYLQWIDNEIIDASICFRYDQSRTNESFFGILNPFTGIWQPDLLSNIPSREEESHVFVSPDLSRGIYLNETNTLALWNYDNQTTMEFLQLPVDHRVFFDAYPTDPSIAWSPDSKQVAVAAPEDLSNTLPLSSQRGVYIIGRNGGESQRITYFINEFNGFQAYGLRWSHDSRYLAFAAGHTAGEIYQQTIYIYDIVSKNYIFRCDTNQSDPIRLYFSPDSQYIAYTNAYSSPLVLTNVQTGFVIEITQRAIIGGWTSNTRWLFP